jgi:hypothetical protein
MIFKGVCDLPYLGMHMYTLVQTSRGNFVVISSVKMQMIEKYKILAYTKHGSYLAYTTAIFNTV